MIGPDLIAQLATIVTAVWFSSRGVVKRLTRVEDKIDGLPCSNGGCQKPPRPKIFVLRGSAVDDPKA